MRERHASPRRPRAPEHEADVAALRALALAFIENVDLNATSLAPELRSVVSQHAELPEESEEVRVMTFHGSKGLTARVVILAGLCV